MLNPQASNKFTNDLNILANNIKSIHITTRPKLKHTPKVQIGFQQKNNHFLPLCPSARTSSVRTTRNIHENISYFTNKKPTSSYDNRRSQSAFLSRSVDLRKNEAQRQRNNGSRINSRIAMTNSFIDFKDPQKKENEKKKKINQTTNSWKIRTGSEARKNRTKINWECDVAITGKKFF